MTNQITRSRLMTAANYAIGNNKIKIQKQKQNNRKIQTNKPKQGRVPPQLTRWPTEIFVKNEVDFELAN